VRPSPPTRVIRYRADLVIDGVYRQWPYAMHFASIMDRAGGRERPPGPVQSLLDLALAARVRGAKATPLAGEESWEV